MKIVQQMVCAVLLLSGLRVEAQVLRTAAQDSAPKFISGTDKATTGISIEIMRAIERVDLTLQFVGDQVFLPFRRIERMLEYGDLDVFFGFIKSDERTAKFTYIDPPMYRVADVLVARGDDQIDIQRLEELAAFAKPEVVLVAAGTNQATQLRKMGIVVDAGAATVIANLEKLSAKRGRLLMQSEIEVLWAIKKKYMYEDVRILPQRFNESGRYVVFSKNVSSETVTKVAHAMEVLSRDGSLTKILVHYR